MITNLKEHAENRAITYRDNDTSIYTLKIAIATLEFNKNPEVVALVVTMKNSVQRLENENEKIKRILDGREEMASARKSDSNIIQYSQDPLQRK